MIYFGGGERAWRMENIKLVECPISNSDIKNFFSWTKRVPQHFCQWSEKR
jgi:hypothetical protein